MRSTWVFVFLSVIPAGAGPITIGSGELLLHTEAARFYVGTPLGPGFFGSLNGVPSNDFSNGFATIDLTGSPGVTADGPLSNLFVDTLSIFKGSPGSTFGITWQDSRDNPAQADTVLELSPATYTSLDPPYSAHDFEILALSLRSATPFLVTYGTGPDALTLPFDVTLQYGSSGTNSGLILAHFATDSSGVLTASLGADSAEFIFKNPTMGSFTMPARLSAESPAGSWHEAPEPAGFGLSALGGALLWMKARRRHRYLRYPQESPL